MDLQPLTHWMARADGYVGLWLGLLVIAMTASALLLAVYGRRQWQRRQQELWAKQRSMETLRSMTWREFEALTAETFTRLGFDVRRMGGAKADGGIDLLVGKGNQTFTVQCKHWIRELVGVAIVREAVGVAVHESVSGAYVVTIQGFTKAAKEFARGKPVHLVDGRKLLAMIAEGRGDALAWRPLPRPKAQAAPRPAPDGPAKPAPKPYRPYPRKRWGRRPYGKKKAPPKDGGA